MRPKDTTIKAWSFSRYSVYRLCPAKAKYKFIDKLQEPSSEALDRGTKIHELAQRYIDGTLPAKLPPELRLFTDDFRAYRKAFKGRSIIQEESWTFNRDWQPVQWNDWNNAWVRIKVDFAQFLDGDVLHIRDWKTGKFRPELNEEYLEQLDLYALGGFTLFPNIKEVRTDLVYLDEGKVFTIDPFHRKDAEQLRKRWEKRVAPLLKDKSFAPRPNDKCRWCHFRKANGGPCKF